MQRAANIPYARQLRVLFSSSMAARGEIGGMMVFIISLIAEMFGDGTWAVAGIPKPKNEKERNIVSEIARRLTTQYAYVDDSKVVFVRIGGMEGWLSFARESRLTIWAMGKVVKRLKSLNRPTLLGGAFDSLNVMTVGDRDYIPGGKPGQEQFDQAIQEYIEGLPENLRPTPEAAAERPLDGWIVISQDLLDRLVAQSKFHQNALRRLLQQKKVARTRVFNIRIITPLGFIKGNAVIGQHMPDGVDVIVAGSTGIKAEILSDGKVYVIAEPQPPKRAIRTNTQTEANNADWLFPLEQKKEWISDFFAKMRSDIAEGRILQAFSDIESVRWRTIKESGNVPEGINAGTGYSVIDLVKHGGDYRKSPFILERMAGAVTDNLIDYDEGNLRFPVPCAINEQVISESAANMAGYFIRVERGTIRRIPKIGVHVISDSDYLSFYDDQGGCDHDDFFDLYYRTVDGVKSVVVIRSPNEIGGYTIFRYVEGDPYPKWKKADGTEVEFPEVDVTKAPKRISEALADGSLVYTGLPSDSMAKEESDQSDRRMYSLDDFLAELDTITDDKVGKYINPTMLYSVVFKRSRSSYPCSQERAIDTFVQPGGPAQEDRAFLTAFGDQLVAEVLESGLGIDRFFWATRNFGSSLPEDVSPNLVKGHFSKSLEILEEAIKDFKEWVSEFAQKHADVQNEVIHHLGGFHASQVKGKRSVYEAYLNANYQTAVDLINRTRKMIRRYNAAGARARAEAEAAGIRFSRNRRGGNIPKSAWPKILKPIMDHYATLTTDRERADFSMALISATYKVKTYEGNVKDNVVFNNTKDDKDNQAGPWPYVLEAMRFYGILASGLDIDDDENVLVRHYTFPWTLTCTNCGKTGQTSNPRVYQRFLLEGICNTCRSANQA